jgi:hypothetical protein
MYLRKKLTIFIFLYLLSCIPAFSTQYFYWNGESGTCDSTVGTPFSTFENNAGVIKCDETPPEGRKYLRYYYPGNGSNSIYTEARLTTTPTNVLGRTYYLACWIKIERIGGNNVFKNSSLGSVDKFIEIDTSGSCENPSPCTRQRQIVLLGRGEMTLPNIATFSTAMYGSINCFNHERAYKAIESGENFHHNYTCNFVTDHCSITQPYVLTYDAWHSLVLGVLEAQSDTGKVQMWLDGTEVMRYTNIMTICGSTIIDGIKMMGSIAQPGYDAPAHYIKWDGIMLTDNWQDLVNGGYLTGAAPTTTSIAATTTTSTVDSAPPAAPTGLRIE